jgi:ribosomal protein S18 acetylase RimI-like enzyme
MQHEARIQDVHIRSGAMRDIDALLSLERAVFAADCMSRKSLRRFLNSKSASVLIAEHDGAVAGAAVVLLHPLSPNAARLYSLAVAPHDEGHGIGALLLHGAEEIAREHGRAQLRLEVHEKNRRAIRLYRREGYAQFGRRCGYYKDLGDALRFRKELISAPAGTLTEARHARPRAGHSRLSFR